jgi:uncharacterized membrane protein YhaH (DUF805 family)
VSFLPIATRELRVAARKRNTFWLRVVAAIVGLVIGVAFMLIMAINNAPARFFGPALFGTLTWMSLAAALTAGIFFTSDCLSEEKREGTLGFLFLTDLRGYDVVAGKLLATSLRGLFALLAIFPILAITLTMGGVTGTHFWKTSLALLAALFCSLAMGLFVSAISRDSQKAMGATVFWLLVFVAAGPITDAIIAEARQVGFAPYFSLTSPGFLFSSAGDWGRSPYWMTFLVTLGIALVLFGLAAILLPRTWQEKASKATMATRGWVYAWKYGGPGRRQRLRRKLLSRDAILWLACRERWQSLGIWMIAILGVAGFVLASMGLPPQAWAAWQFIRVLVLFVFYLWAASQACRFFVEARKSGLTELLLAAPLSEGQMVRGHWRALLRMYGLPVLLLMGLDATGNTLATTSWSRLGRGLARTVSTSTTTNNINGANVVTITSVSNGTVTITTMTGTNKTTQTTSQPFTKPPGSGELILLSIVGTAAAAVTIAVNLIALGWFGMWMGMTSRNVNFATLKTLLFVEIIPVMVIFFCVQMFGALLFLPLLRQASSGTGSSSSMFIIFPIIKDITSCLLSVGKDIFFIVFARNRLFGAFREVASHSFDQPRGIIAPPIPPAIPAPPVAA